MDEEFQIICWRGFLEQKNARVVRWAIKHLNSTEIMYQNWRHMF